MPIAPPKPMLACKKWDLKDLSYPVHVQPKLDGVRAIVTREGVMGRSGKLIKNKAVQREFGVPELVGCDGELIAGDATSASSCRRTTGVLNSPSDTTQVTYIVYDKVHQMWPFSDRLQGLQEMDKHEFARKHMQLCPTWLVHTEEDVLKLEARWVAEGYEGLIVRRPDALYKFGRSTKRDGALLALKRFSDAEATVTGTTEEMHNANAATENAWGRTERSSHKANKIGKDTLGALICKAEGWSDQFEIGTGFTAEERADLWRNRDGLVGQVVKFKFFPHGTYDRPRHPVFIAFRMEEDMPNPEESEGA